MKSWVNMPKEWRLTATGQDPFGGTALLCGFSGLIYTLAAIQNAGSPWLVALYAFGTGLLLGMFWVASRTAKREKFELDRDLHEIANLRLRLAAYEQRYGMLIDEEAA